MAMPSKQIIVFAFRYLHKQRPRLVLGIETSCDDTGAAVVNSEGHILGEELHSQKQLHLDHGGIIPPIARDLHQQHISNVVNRALEKADIRLQDVDAIATTVKPGLPLSLLVGMKYGKKLAMEAQKPFIPIHHMEAHALTARMMQKIHFPFLALLISGGNCLLCLVRNVADFLLLGQSLDDAPGEALDKVARRLKLKNLPECYSKAGGEAIEYLAKSGNPTSFSFPLPMQKYRDCNFSFSGLKYLALKTIGKEESQQGVEGGRVLPNAADICASFQLAVVKHFIKKLHRAILYTEVKQLLPSENRTLVVSGGVACNAFIRTALTTFCSELSVKTIYPPPHLCTDNGIMIAWNGIERLLAGVGVTHDLDAVDVEAKCPLGVDISRSIAQEDIASPRTKFIVTPNDFKIKIG